MKFISWNVNGFRAILKKGFAEFFLESDADFFAIQETKMQLNQADYETPEGYFEYYNCAERKGYSGTAVFTRHEPLNVFYGIDGKHDDEGRVITLEYEDFYFINSYVPNSQSELARIDYRLEYENDFREYISRLDAQKPVIYCGDLNVAHEEIDLKNPKPNRGKAGFSDEEREKIGQLLEAGFTDSFRYLHPDETGAYSWWSYRFNARANNAGWRIDYFLVSDRLASGIKSADILSEVMGSDHCPIQLVMEDR